MEENETGMQSQIMRLIVLLLFIRLTICAANDSNFSQKGPNYVQLTTKQNLIMNQILNFYGISDVTDPICRNHTAQFRSGLRAFEPWALRMFDSSSKVQAGILLGNLVEFGSFSQCVGIKHDSDSGHIFGKYCLIKIKPSLQLIRKILEMRNITPRRFPKVRLIIERSSFSWSLCVPKSCPIEDVFRHFNKNIMDLGQGLEIQVSLKPNDCISRDSGPVMDWSHFAIIAFLALFPAISIVASAIDWIYYKGANSNNQLLDVFSVRANFLRIISRSSRDDLGCIHGLRFLSTCYVVIGHRYLMMMFFPVINGLEILEWILNYSSTIIIGGTTCVDTFFLISGMLVSIGFFEHVTSTGRFNILGFYVHRYVRITLPLAITVLVHATLIQFLGSGPLWYETYWSHQKPCRDYWWSTLLHIQSYINPDTLCIIQAWYLSCDMPYYYLSPLVLYPIWKRPSLGFVLYFLVYVASIAVSFYLAWLNQYEGGMPITNQLLETDYFQRHYIAPHTRAAPYIIGLGLGYAIFSLKGSKIRMGAMVVASGWFLALTSMISSVLGCHSFQLENHDYSRLEASVFLSCSRSAWTLGVVWIIWTCLHGYGGVINYILSAHLFKVLGRISYGIFLLHMIFQFLKCGANKLPIYFSNFTSIYDSFGDLFTMIIIGFFFTMFYELPLIKLEGMVLNSRKANRIGI